MTLEFPEYAAGQIAQAGIDWQIAAQERMRPCAVFGVRVFIDGDQWCALYGEDLQSGVAGFGDSPDAATRDFDRAWASPLSTTTPRETKP